MPLFNLDFCSAAMTINGVLQDQVKVYTADKDSMSDQLSQTGTVMMQALSLNANCTTTTPLEGQINSLEMI